MSKNLIIVESPAKTRTLKKFLGRDWAIEASVGHIRDLPKKDMGLGPDYEPNYAVLAAKKDVVKRLQEAASRADRIYLAPDPDREGEAIAWHIAQVLGREAGEVHRVTFNEITRKAVLAALEHPGEIDLRLVDAQQARRVLDRLMGFKLSPLLWKKVKQGLSAGRVQSVALKMVCDRQREIDAFVPVEYWLLGARLAGAEPPEFSARLHQVDGRKAEVGSAGAAAEIEALLGDGDFRVAAVERKESRQRPTPPFITSRLQQEAARRFGFAVKRTMALAQGLYEGRTIGERGQLGLITYMRTDSTRVSAEALDGVRDHIAATYGADKLPEKPNFYRSKKDAQDAHEAIRPTYLDLPPDAVAAFLKPDELKLYRLIWERFVASQMLPAVFDVTQVDVDRGRCRLRATGKVLKSAGFLAVYQELVDRLEGGDDEGGAAQLPPLAEGDLLRRVALEKEQKFTAPPPQYSEATLIKALEENGIGRPSTYAAILSTISEREYVEKREGRLRPTPLGKVVNKLLQSGFEDVISEGYTARLEEELDDVEEGKIRWKQVVAEFDEKFARDLVRGAADWPDVKVEGLPLGEVDAARAAERCPKCGRPLVVRFGRYGAFVGCTGYREEPSCDYTSDLEAKPETPSGAESVEPVAPCELCGRPMELKRSRFGPFYGCTGYPECKNIRRLGPKPAPPKDTGVACPECGQGTIQEKKSRRGKVFYSCSRYPSCKYALWNKPVEEPCPKCAHPFLTEKTTKKKGTVWLCPKEGCGYEVPAPEPVEA